MREELEIRIRKDLRPLSKDELVEMILFLIRTSPHATRYATGDGYDLPDVVRIIRQETLTGKIGAIIEENDRLLEELSELRKSPPGTSMESISIMNRLRDNHDKCNQLSKLLDKLETA